MSPSIHLSVQLLVASNLIAPLPKIDQRKCAYMDFVRATIQQLKDEGKFNPELDVTVAAFSLIGTILWLGPWYRPAGKLSSEQVAEMIYQMTLGGITQSEKKQVSARGQHRRTD